MRSNIWSNYSTFLVWKLQDKGKNCSVTMEVHLGFAEWNRNEWGCRPSHSPIEANKRFGEVKDGIPIDKGRYQSLVERLIYLSHRGPDITFSVSMVSQFMHSPNEDHLEDPLNLKIFEKHSRKGFFSRKMKIEELSSGVYKCRLGMSSNW